MWDKRRIHKQIVGWDGAKRSPTLLLLLAVVMGGCSQMGSPWQYNSEPAKAATQADLATFNEAVSMVESQRYEEAAGKFRQVFDRFAASADHRQRAAESLFWIGFCREKQRRLDEARAIYLRLAEEYAGTRAAEEANKRRLRIPAGEFTPSDGDRR